MRSKVPSAEEFNRKMHECVLHKKLIEFKKFIKWFSDDEFGNKLKDLEKDINKKIKEIPKESINFDTEVHVIYDEVK